MASNTETHGNFPQRSENILADETHPGYPRDEIEQPERHDRNASDGSSSINQDTDGAALETTDTYTSSSGEERAFEPITSEDRAHLQRIASTFGGSVALARSNTAASSKLERRDTLAGVELGDPVLDPASPEFNVYKWARMYGKVLSLKVR